MRPPLSDDDEDYKHFCELSGKIAAASFVAITEVCDADKSDADYCIFKPMAAIDGLCHTIALMLLMHDKHDDPVLLDRIMGALDRSIRLSLAKMIEDKVAEQMQLRPLKEGE